MNKILNNGHKQETQKWKPNTQKTIKIETKTLKTQQSLKQNKKIVNITDRTHNNPKENQISETIKPSTSGTSALHLIADPKRHENQKPQQTQQRQRQNSQNRNTKTDHKQQQNQKKENEQQSSTLNAPKIVAYHINHKNFATQHNTIKNSILTR